MIKTCEYVVVEPQVGGKNGGGAVLARFGLTLVERYRVIERLAEQATRKELLVLLADVGVVPQGITNREIP